MDRSFCADMACFAESVFARFLTAEAVPQVDGEPSAPQRVVIRQLAYEDLDLRHIMVTRVVSSFEPLSIRPEAPAVKASGKNGPAASRGDLLSLACSAAKHVKYPTPKDFKTTGSSSTSASSSSMPAATSEGGGGGHVAPGAFVTLLDLEMDEARPSVDEAEVLFGGVLHNVDAASLDLAD